MHPQRHLGTGAPGTAGSVLSSVDRAFLNMERATNPMMIVALIVLGTPIKRTLFRETISERFASYERFRCLPVEGLSQAFWQRVEQFDIDDHVLEAALPVPEGQHELQALVGSLASEPFAPGRPPWTFHVVEHFERGSAIVARVHHCYADGIALVQILLKLSENGPTRRRTRHASADVSRHAPPDESGWIVQALDEARRLGEKGLHLALHPGAMASAATHAGGLVQELAHISMLPDDPPTRLKRPLCGVRRVAWGEALSLEEVKTIGRVLGCSVNDVLISTLAGALGQYLEAQGEAVEGLTLRASVPVDLRHTLGNTAPLGNCFGLVFVDLPIGVHHPLERLYGVRATMQAVKGSEQAMLTYGLLTALGTLPRPLEDFAMNLFSAKASLVASNLRGPQSALYIAGVPVQEILFWVPQSGSIGMGVSMLSYCGRVHFGVIADRMLVADPGELITLIETGFEQLVLLVLLGGGALAR